MRINPDIDGDCFQRMLVSNFIGSFSNLVVRRAVGGRGRSGRKLPQLPGLGSLDPPVPPRACIASAST
ncbi:hypothetical protein LP419_06445 [Massilia sp. H-1]|nr:hypothetical protein LP419_06445 [Massilia sp. H-1]